jgi:hypothetical protein
MGLGIVFTNALVWSDFTICRNEFLENNVVGSRSEGEVYEVEST